ncbi:D-lactonohydrolase-like protein [Ramaria rubella]|nr:D-lactonohydrolase-like protein [Ramaria rubella]
MSRLVFTKLAGLLALLGRFQTQRVSSQAIPLPAQTVLIDVPGLAVLGANGTFRNVTTPFNPTNHTTPVFQVWDSQFLDILGPNPSVRLISERDGFAFAHEAPIWDPATDQVFFASGNGGPLSMSDINHNNEVFVINLKDVRTGLEPQNITAITVPITPAIQMVNGGTPYKGNLLFVSNGRGSLPPGINLVNPNPPFNSTTILDNMHGRQFNSLDDVKVHPKSGEIFFTDVSFSFLLGFRPPPLLPNQVYRFNPQTSEVGVVADGFEQPNGIAFSPDGSVAYITDTGALGAGKFNSTKTATVYVFDVDETTQMLTNRRVLAWVDTGIPDGIHVDSNGNIYTSCADGVQVFDPAGVLLGKVFLGMSSANHIFAGQGRLVVLADTKIFLVEFAAGPSFSESSL